MRFLFAAALVVILTASPSAQIVGIEEAFPRIQFGSPIQVASTPDVPGRFWVVEQGASGRARIVTLEPGDAAATVALDISDRVLAGGELGLLGIAFHPDFETNGRLFVHYTAPVETAIPRERVAETRIAEFERSAADPLTFDPDSEQILLRADQPYGNHNGGSIDFGPDGFLYIALGDGGDGGDPENNGQDPTTLLGAILRIDVDDVPDGGTYGIPDDNPFAMTDGPERDEIFAFGLRNPFKIDASERGLWVGDVGQGRWEEVDRVEVGGNYGWNEVEGPECFRNGCDLSAYEPPVAFYGHGADGGRSITGGYVVPFAGDAALSDHYVYGDFISGRMWAISAVEEDPTPFVILEPGENGNPMLLISSIDPDPTTGDILVTDYSSGRIFRLLRGSTPVEAGPPLASLSVSLAGPTPFQQRTAVRVESAGSVRVTVVDVRGREVAVLWDGPAPTAPLDVDGARLAPGAYAIRAVSAESTASAWVVRAE